MSCELGRKLHRSVLFYIENYHGADDGAERPQKHTRYVTVNAERCLSHTANFSYKCVHPAVRLESMASCYHELAAVLFVCVMMEKKTSHSPFSPPLSRSASKHLTHKWLQCLQIFTLLAPKVPKPKVVLVIGHW